VEIIVLGLATWRLASLLSREDGPWAVFSRFRGFLGVEHDDHGNPRGTNTLAEGVLCLWCCSVWIGLLLGALYYLWRDSWWLSLPFALSAAAIAIDRWNDG